MIVARGCDDPDETDILAATGNSFLERHYSRTDIDLLNSYPDKERETEIKREIERESERERERWRYGEQQQEKKRNENNNLDPKHIFLCLQFLQVFSLILVMFPLVAEHINICI